VQAPHEVEPVAQLCVPVPLGTQQDWEPAGLEQAWESAAVPQTEVPPAGVHACVCVLLQDAEPVGVQAWVVTAPLQVAVPVGGVQVWLVTAPHEAGVPVGVQLCDVDPTAPQLTPVASVSPSLLTHVAVLVWEPELAFHWQVAVRVWVPVLAFHSQVAVRVCEPDPAFQLHDESQRVCEPLLAFTLQVAERHCVPVPLQTALAEHAPHPP
jgi:hypothetical protein